MILFAYAAFVLLELVAVLFCLIWLAVNAACDALAPKPTRDES